jgi:gamma-glutamyltranspeptidase/glutathione hydrolase
MRDDEETRRIFLGRLGLCPLGGSMILQPQLAATLEALTGAGASGAPQSWSDVVGGRMVAYLAGRGGFFSQADLSGVRVTERAPIEGHFMGKRIVTMGPPSSGGLILISWLQAYERMRARMPSADKLELWLDASRESYFDRAMLMGDPDFVDVPVAKLVSDAYASEQAARVDGVVPVSLPQSAVHDEGSHTTHLSVRDADGSAVALTLSINLPFGSGLTVPGTGVLLNDEMDDFFLERPNAFGLVGNDKNEPAPGKRPLSSMTPTMVFEKDELAIVLGSPGGSQIPTAIAWTLRGMIEEGLDASAAIHAPRVHHQWSPDAAEKEPAFDGLLPPPFRKDARTPLFPMGNVQMLFRASEDPATWSAVSDCRGEGSAWSAKLAPREPDDRRR